jgi:hypothetical protein
MSGPIQYAMLYHRGLGNDLASGWPPSITRLRRRLSKFMGNCIIAYFVTPASADGAKGMSLNMPLQHDDALPLIPDPPDQSAWRRVAFPSTMSDYGGTQGSRALFIGLYLLLSIV